MVRLGLITGFLALIGVLLSGLAAYRIHDQELTVDGIALARAIDVHASLVQDRLTERELLARVSSGLFRSPSVIKANMLQPLRASIYAFKTDFVVASWVARLKPEELSAAHTELANAGFPNPTIRGNGGVPLQASGLTEPVDVVMDVEPRNADTMAFPGRSLDQDPILGPMLNRAMTDLTPVASDPLPLLGKDGPVGIVLAAPVLRDNGTQPAGFVTFSYELAPLMLTNDDLSLFSVALKDPRRDNSELIATERGNVISRSLNSQGPIVVRKVFFGGRDWTLTYYAKTNTMNRAMQTAAIVAAIGLALTAIVGDQLGAVGTRILQRDREQRQIVVGQHQRPELVGKRHEPNWFRGAFQHHRSGQHEAGHPIRPRQVNRIGRDRLALRHHPRQHGADGRRIVERASRECSGHGVARFDVHQHVDVLSDGARIERLVVKVADCRIGKSGGRQRLARHLEIGGLQPCNPGSDHEIGLEGIDRRAQRLQRVGLDHRRPAKQAGGDARQEFAFRQTILHQACMDVDRAGERDAVEGQLLFMDPIGGKPREQSSDQCNQANDEAQPNHSFTLV